MNKSCANCLRPYDPGCCGHKYRKLCRLTPRMDGRQHGHASFHFTHTHIISHTRTCACTHAHIHAHAHALSLHRQNNTFFLYCCTALLVFCWKARWQYRTQHHAPRPRSVCRMPPAQITECRAGGPRMMFVVVYTRIKNSQIPQQQQQSPWACFCC